MEMSSHRFLLMAHTLWLPDGRLDFGIEICLRDVVWFLAPPCGGYLLASAGNNYQVGRGASEMSAYVPLQLVIGFKRLHFLICRVWGTSLSWAIELGTWRVLEGEGNAGASPHLRRVSAHWHVCERSACTKGID